MANVMGVNSTPKAVAEATVPGGSLGKNEFLKLLTTQLSHQNPLEPMDNAKTIAQLAQFSALEQMQKLNDQFDTAQRADHLVQSLALSGEPIAMEMLDGSKVEGTVEKVSWDDTGMMIQINGQSYPVSDITTIAKQVV